MYRDPAFLQYVNYYVEGTRWRVRRYGGRSSSGCCGAACSGNITEDEERELNLVKGIDWYFQPKAWASPKFTIAWLKHTFGVELKRLGISRRVLLLVDNLAGQDVRFSAGLVGRTAKAAAEAINVP